MSAVIERVVPAIVGLIIAAVGVGVILGSREVARRTAIRDRSSPLYLLYDFVGASEEHPWSIIVGGIFMGAILILLGLYISWNSLTWPRP